MGDLQKYCVELGSKKIKERKHSYEMLLTILESEDVINKLNNDEIKFVSWQYIFSSVNNYIIEEAERNYQDEIKKKNIPSTKKTRNDLLLKVLKHANKEELRISVTELMQHVKQGLNTKFIKKYYHDTYLVLLRDHILSKETCMGQIDIQDWSSILNLLKELYTEKINNLKVLQCLYLLVKWGTLHKMSIISLRKQFDFIQDICINLTLLTSRVEQEITLQLLTEFCKHNIIDCRQSCCKLGEDTFENVYQLYSNATIQVKTYFFEFLLLQIRIHHPYGVTQEDLSSMAFSWTKWHEILLAINKMLQCEIEDYKTKIKLKNFFSSTQGITSFHSAFLALIIEIYNLFNSGLQDVYATTLNDTPLVKKQKIETKITQLISDIEINWDGLSITIITELLKTYPNLITSQEFIRLLQILATFQAENKDTDLTISIYKCLIVLFDVHNNLPENTLLNLESTWLTIYECTLRFIGWNCDNEESYILIQKLIMKYQNYDFFSYFQTYLSNNKVINKHSLNALNIACLRNNFTENIDFLKNDTVIARTHLLKWILNTSNDGQFDSELYTELITSQILISLSCKLWPKNDIILHKNSNLYTSTNGNWMEEVMMIYALNSFKTTLTTPVAKLKEEFKTHLMYEEVFEEFKLSIQNFLLKTFDLQNFSLNNYINGLIFLANILSGLLHINVISEENFEAFELTIVLKEAFEKFYMELINNKSILPAALKQIQKLFSLYLHPLVCLKLRELFHDEYIALIFDFLYNQGKAKDIIKLLSLYCCSYGQEMSESQINIVDAISKLNFNYSNEDDYHSVLTFISFIKVSKIGSVPTCVFANIFIMLKNLCNNKYFEYKAVVDVLKTLKNMCKHVLAINDLNALKDFLSVLLQFYEFKSNYGPKVCKTILECFEEILKIDFNEEKIRTAANVDICNKLESFLQSPYLEIRFATAKMLIATFNCLDYNKQELILYNIHNNLQNDVSSKNVLTPEEEETYKSAMVNYDMLHVYSAIITVSHLWRAQTLYFLLEIAYLKSVKFDSLRLILDATSKNINYINCSELMHFYSDCLIQNWYLSKHSIHKFPFKLLNCANDIEFLTKFQQTLIPIAITKHDNDLIENVARKIQCSRSDLIEKSFAKIAAAELILKTPQHEAIALSETELLISHVDDVILEILKSIYDEHHFYEKFNFHSKLSPICTSQTINFTEYESVINRFTNILSTESIMSSLMNKYPDKLQQIILHLQANIYKTASNQKNQQLAFYQYTIFVDYLLKNLNFGHNLYMYFKRNILALLMHFVKFDYKNYTPLNTMACKYLTKLSFLILSEDLNQSLIMIVNDLISIARFENELSSHCIDLLKLLLIDNTGRFENIMQMLDPFPNDRKFRDFIETYNNIKYKNGSFTLKQEITNFLEAGNLVKNVDSREEGLKYLRKLLSERKSELKQIYDELGDNKYSLIDSNSSIVHQLICMLLKLASSNNNHISVEATRCLGELGPSDITTMVLEIEKNYSDVNCNAFELVTGQIVALLLDFLVDSDIEVVLNTSCIMSEILQCKEGKTVVESQLDYGQGIIEKALLSPFILKIRNLKSMKVTIIRSSFEGILDNPDLWYPENNCSHEEWIKKLVTNLLQIFELKDCYLPKLINLCQVKVEFCEFILPLIIYLILIKNDPLCCDIIGMHISGFFDKHSQIIALNNKTTSIVTNKSSVKCMLNIINFVRIQKVVNNNACAQLTLDYLKLAQAAQYCGAHCTSIFYAELWCQDKIKRFSHTEKAQSATPLEIIVQNEKETKTVLQQVFQEAYNQLGDLNAMQGCKLMDMYNIQEQINCYKQQKQWNQVLFQYDIQDNLITSDALYAFKECAMYELPLKFDIISESQYECAWRLSRWNLPEINNNFKTGFEKHRYNALKALKEDHKTNFNDAILNARNVIIESLKSASLESSKNLYEISSQLQSLQEIEDFEKALENENVERITNKWSMQDMIDINDFHFVEPIKTQRIIMLKLKASRKFELRNALVRFAVELIRVARYEKHYNIAERTLANLLSIPNLTNTIENQILFERAQVTWFSNKDMGKSMIRHLLDNCQDDTALYSASLKLYGTWLVETSSANAQKIISDFFLKSLQCTNYTSSHSCNTYDELARFSDQQYQRFVTYISSTEFERKVKNMETSRITAETLNKKFGQSTQDEKRAMVTHQRQSKIDEIEIERTYNEKNMYLMLAAKYYLLNLQHDDKSNIRIFRIISLWLQNKNDSELAALLKRALQNIPSYKFIPILPQLIPHLSNLDDDLFPQEIFAIIERCAKDHPHHTIPIIMSIANANKDIEYTKCKTKTQLNEPRILGGQKLILKLKKNKLLKTIIDQMELVHDALIQLAYITNEKYKDPSTVHDIPKNSKIRKIKDFSNIFLPTLTVPVRRDCNYSNITGIYNFDTKFTSVGGINVPKRVTCVSTDGKTRLQLVKGQDDLRQDAVMQQVFTIMNELLASNKQTKNLRIRTYKIVPLSTRSGILEWVENSMPIGEYLVGKKGAHELYNKGDLTPVKCREIIRNSAKVPNDKKLKMFLDICQKFQPVFHKFFEMSFPQTTIWYERRRAYMHSVATSSMCGYILGIGDRHVQNILIDKTTAEVIHIDFGIAFEQGLVLPTPETVPFRLSRDIEDGMGVFGIQGVFKRSCENTMDVLRKNAETIISILEVLLYDPLYSWTITPAQAYSKQFSDEGPSCLDISSEDNTAVNTMAERALLRLRSKLTGTEHTSPTTVEGQVERLLQEARDPGNLSRLFYGWQAFL